MIILYRITTLLFLWTALSGILSAQDFESSNLPLIIIETDGQTIFDEPKIDVEMGVIYNGEGQRNFLSDPFNEYSGWAGIEIRGSTSQFLYDKKSYALETRDETGANRNVSLLGLPEENDWVLHGPYGDKSLIRNALAYKIASDLMDYAPQTRFVELFIDDDYLGVYLLTEKIKRDKNRVDISRLTPEEVSGDQLTGGYILKIDKNTGAYFGGFPSEYPPEPGAWQEIFFQYHYPKPEDIVTAQENYIQKYMADFEDLMDSELYADSVLGYHQYIDVGTFVDYFIVNEVCKNVDAYRLSTFFYKDRDSVDHRLKMGPVWDFNLGFGNVDFCLGAGTSGWVKDYNAVCPDDLWLVPFWWDRLWKDRNFRIAISDRWTELRAGLLSDERLLACIDSMANELEEAQERNFERWPVLSQYVWPNWFVGDTYTSEINYLENWLLDRLEWIDGEMEHLTEVFYFPEDYFDPKVYPNPFSDRLLFEYYVRQTEEVTFRIFNALGQLVADFQDLDHPNGTNNRELDSRIFAPGIYIYQVWINGVKKAQGKLVKAP